MKPEREIGILLTRLGLTLTTAESCTGGLIANRITNVPGSSNYFKRGYIVYSNCSKSELLGIKPSLIKRHGAVSREVVCAMAAGAKKASSADYTIGVTGIAGPISDESKKPVGLVYIAVGMPDGSVHVKKFNFKGSRLQIKKMGADAALGLLLESIRMFNGVDALGTR